MTDRLTLGSALRGVGGNPRWPGLRVDGPADADPLVRPVAGVMDWPGLRVDGPADAESTVAAVAPFGRLAGAES